ncbi:MAG: hypothetical protein AAF982_07175, partial [Pseudomonadota bacterium]
CVSGKLSIRLRNRAGIRIRFSTAFRNMGISGGQALFAPIGPRSGRRIGPDGERDHPGAEDDPGIGSVNIP